MKKALIIFLILIITSGGARGQKLDAQSFGFDEADTEISGGSAGALKVSIEGEISTSVTGYIMDFSDGADHVTLGDFFAGSLNFSAKSSFAEGVINLNISPDESPVQADEAYLHAFFGKFDIEAGLRKLTWGKADSFGPLDVINPLDSSEIFTEMADNISLMGAKIARPLVHAALRFGKYSKIEAVFVPNFTPARFAAEGRWAPGPAPFQRKLLEQAAAMSMTAGIEIDLDLEPSAPDTGTVDYAQTGLRFTTTIGSSDIGVQYYYGRLFQPSVKLNFFPVPSAQYLYNPYHQIGLDYAQVLLGFNVRAEFAANITEDLKGDDGSVYNPSLAWSLGFDRDLFMGINLNLQVNETIRLLNDKVGGTNLFTGRFDIEDGMPLTATRLTSTITKRFLRDTLELRAAVVWGIEDGDCAVMPALIWTNDDVRIAFSGGFFMGDEKGQLGQYKDNHFLKLSISYAF
ncbi:MAG: hypothetical protein LBH16_12650 [Treponema sp.]|nr:hypothetical protein [Treponema sp.]